MFDLKGYLKLRYGCGHFSAYEVIGGLEFVSTLRNFIDQIIKFEANDSDSSGKIIDVAVVRRSYMFHVV